MPGSSNTPCRANVFRFIRVICQEARRAISHHSRRPRPAAVSIWNGTSGTYETIAGLERLELPHERRQGIKRHLRVPIK